MWLFVHQLWGMLGETLSGNALITFDLPKEYQDADKTGGAGQTLGAVLVLTTDFQQLEMEV